MTKTTRLLLIIVSISLLTGFGPFGDKRTREQEQQDIRDMRSQVLKELYEEAPEAEKQIAESAGYAVFSNIGINLLVLSTGNGFGVAHNNSTGEDTYMKMYSAGVGVGYGVKDFRAVFIFGDLDAMNYFIEEGWQATAQTDAAAVTGEKGDAMNYEIEIAPNVKLYQMTENGLALQATLQGTKYVLDKDLN